MNNTRCHKIVMLALLTSTLFAHQEIESMDLIRRLRNSRLGQLAVLAVVAGAAAFYFHSSHTSNQSPRICSSPIPGPEERLESPTAYLAPVVPAGQSASRTVKQQHDAPELSASDATDEQDFAQLTVPEKAAYHKFKEVLQSPRSFKTLVDSAKEFYDVAKNKLFLPMVNDLYRNFFRQAKMNGQAIDINLENIGAAEVFGAWYRQKYIEHRQSSPSVPERLTSAPTLPQPSAPPADAVAMHDLERARQASLVVAAPAAKKTQAESKQQAKDDFFEDIVSTLSACDAQIIARTSEEESAQIRMAVASSKSDSIPVSGVSTVSMSEYQRAIEASKKEATQRAREEEQERNVLNAALRESKRDKQADDRLRSEAQALAAQNERILAYSEQLADLAGQRKALNLGDQLNSVETPGEEDSSERQPLSQVPVPGGPGMTIPMPAPSFSSNYVQDDLTDDSEDAELSAHPTLARHKPLNVHSSRSKSAQDAQAKTPRSNRRRKSQEDGGRQKNNALRSRDWSSHRHGVEL